MIELTIVIGLLLAAAVFLWLWSKPPRVREPRCAHCGYDVRGLPQAVCPECGADLYLPNAIIMPGEDSAGRPAASLGSRLFAWSIVCLVTGLIGSGIAAEIPRDLKQRAQWDVTLGGVPAFGYRHLRVSIVDTAWRERDLQPRRGEIIMERLNGASTSIAVDRLNSMLGSGAALTPLTEAALRDWLVRSGAAGTAGQLDYQARALLAAIQSLNINVAMSVPPHDDWTPVGAGGRRLDVFGGGHGSSSGAMYPSTYAVNITRALFLGLWLLGGAVIARRLRWRASSAH